jgi:hypothetical protein
VKAERSGARKTAMSAIRPSRCPRSQPDIKIETARPTSTFRVSAECNEGTPSSERERAHNLRSRKLLRARGISQTLSYRQRETPSVVTRTRSGHLASVSASRRISVYETITAKSPHHGHPTSVGKLRVCTERDSQCSLRRRTNERWDHAGPPGIL